MTSVTLKVFPAPRSYRTWRYRANGLTRALSCLEKLSRFPLDLVAIEMDRCGTIYLRGVGSDRVLDATQVRLKDLMGQESKLLEPNLNRSSGAIAAMIHCRFFPTSRAEIQIPSLVALR